MTPDAPAHLLLVERDERLRGLLRAFLKQQGFLVSVARDVDHARRLMAGLEFDLIVLDAGLGGARDLDVAGGAPVLALLGKDDPEGEGLRKPFEPGVLRARIDATLNRRPPPANPVPRSVVMGDMRFDVDSGALIRGDAPVRLTATELHLMRILAGRAGEPVGRGELVAQLGRSGLATKARAVDVQITRLRRKLESDPKSPRHLQTVRGAGYMLVGD
jgi:two-component system phosphate regulon response regulator OmpR